MRARYKGWLAKWHDLAVPRGDTVPLRSPRVTPAVFWQGGPMPLGTTVPTSLTVRLKFSLGCSQGIIQFSLFIDV